MPKMGEKKKTTPKKQEKKGADLSVFMVLLAIIIALALMMSLGIIK